MPVILGSVPRLWPGATIVCIASGPSLIPEDVEYCRGKARVIVVKDGIRLAPWADVLYACGADTGRWWPLNGPKLADYPGLRFTLDPKAAPWATVLKNTGFSGLESQPNGLRTGKNSGYQAINLAVHLGAARIVLLGYDMQQGPKGEQRWFGSHPWQTRGWAELGHAMVPMFDTLVEPLANAGITVVNATRRTALDCFPKVPLVRALRPSSGVAA
jgi:hypothetical protein